MSDFLEPNFRPADCVDVKIQSSGPITAPQTIRRAVSRYHIPVLPQKKEPASEKPLPLKTVQKASPPPSRIPESDERRIMLKIEELLKNEARIVEVEEENRVLIRMVARLQAENDALKAQ